MTTSAKSGQSTLMQYGDGDDPELFTTVAEVTNIDPPDETDETIEATSHDSTADEYVPSGCPNSGETTFDANFINDATATAVRGLRGAAASNWQICFPNWGARTKTFTADPATEILTAAAHLLTTGQPVRVSSSGTLPAGLSANTTYYVIWVDADTLQLAATNALAVAGTAINITDAGSGTHTLQIGTRLDMSGLVNSVKHAAPRKGPLAYTVKMRLSGANALA